MEASSALQHSNSTWKLCASVFELLLSAIFLLQLAVVSLTFQLIKFLGEELPCWNNAYCYHRSVSCSSTANATSSIFNQDPEVGSSSSRSDNREGSFKPFRPQNTSAFSFDKFYCSKCKCLLTSSQNPSSKDANDLHNNEDDASSCNDGGMKTSHRDFHVEETSARSILQKCRSMQEGKSNDVLVERWSHNIERRVLSNDICSDRRTDHLQVEQQVKEISSRILEEVMESQHSMQEAHVKVRSAEVEVEDCVAVKEPDIVTKCLKDALQKEHENFCALYAELEEERSSAETAANEAMAMISRLQDEKAALQMEAAHYQRMVEEKAAYDDQAMTMMKEILYRKEKENFVLEKEMRLIKSRYVKEVKRASKRSKETEQMPLFTIEKDPSLVLDSDKGPLLLLQGVNKTSEVKEDIQEKCTKANVVPCTLGTTEVQPSKRLKSTESHMDLGSENHTLVSESTTSQSLPDMLLNYPRFHVPEHKVDYEASVSGEASSLMPLRKIQQKGRVLDFAIYKDDFGSILSCLEALQVHLKRHTKSSGLNHENPVQLRHSYSMPSGDSHSQGARGASFSDCSLSRSVRMASLESEGTLTSTGTNPRPALLHLNGNKVSHDFAACSPHVRKDKVTYCQSKEQVSFFTVGDCHSDGNPSVGNEPDAHRLSLQVQLFNMERDLGDGISSNEVAGKESETLGSLSPLSSSNNRANAMAASPGPFKGQNKSTDSVDLLACC